MRRDVELSPSFSALLGLMRARFTLASFVVMKREGEKGTHTLAHSLSHYPLWYFISYPFALWFFFFFFYYPLVLWVSETEGQWETRRQMQITWFDWKRGPETVYLSARVSALLNKMALWLQLEVAAVFLLLQWLCHQISRRILKASRRVQTHVYSWPNLHTHLHISTTLIYRAYLFVFLKVYENVLQ